MTELRTATTLFIVFFAFSAFGQKVKYKDIYSLLSTKQYDAAEPFLKRYLAGDQGNPNAFLFMGMIYQEKVAACHVLRETPSLVAYADSAIQCFDKASSLLTEREIKRNKEYYQAYNRRDLRTGEFGIALSDIQFDLQKRKEALLTRSAAAKMIRHHLESADSLYAASASAYKVLAQHHSTGHSLFLRANDSTVALLDDLSSCFDAALKAVRLYQSSMSSPGVPAYRHDFNLRTLSAYPTEGMDAIDFLAEEVSLWDYGTFAADARKKILDDILPLQKETVTLLTALSAAESESGDHAEVTALPFDRFGRYDDKDPLPLALARLYIADRQYHEARANREAVADSLDVHLQLELARSEVRALERVDSAVALFRLQDLKEGLHRYARFLPTHLGTTQAVVSLLDTVTAAVDTSRQRVNENLAMRELEAQRLRVGEDYIPLTAADTLEGYRPLLTVDEQYTIGVKRVDSVSFAGYFYAITPSRVPDIAATFALDTKAFDDSHWPSVKALSTDANGLLYYVLIYSEDADQEKYPAKVAKVYRIDGLSWATDIKLGFLPESLEYEPAAGTLIVRGADTLIIDKNGNPQ